jgi:hypothetical protein
LGIPVEYYRAYNWSGRSIKRHRAISVRS